MEARARRPARCGVAVGLCGLPRPPFGFVEPSLRDLYCPVPLAALAAVCGRPGPGLGLGALRRRAWGGSPQGQVPSGPEHPGRARRAPGQREPRAGCPRRRGRAGAPILAVAPGHWARAGRAVGAARGSGRPPSCVAGAQAQAWTRPSGPVRRSTADQCPGRVPRRGVSVATAGAPGRRRGHDRRDRPGLCSCPPGRGCRARAAPGGV